MPNDSGVGHHISLGGLKSMKRIVASCLVLLLAASAFAGCAGKDESQGKENPQSGNNQQGEQKDSTKKDEVGYPKSFTYWVQLPGPNAAASKTFNDVGAYKELEKITGTKVEFKHPSGDNKMVQEQLNIMLASGNLADVIETDWVTIPRGPQAAINDGTIISLNELIEKHAPNLKKYMEDNPDVAKMLKTDDGDLYVFPFIRGDDSLAVFFGPMLRKDWLDKLKLEMPTTFNEWEKVLIAFRDQDPNGNGEKDEIPFYLELKRVFAHDYNAMVGSFGVGGDFYQDNGRVKYGPIQPGYKDFLTLMNRWYSMKLLDQDFAATDSKLLDSKVTGNKLGAFYGTAGAYLGKYMGMMKDKNPEFNLLGPVYPQVDGSSIKPLGQKNSYYFGKFSAAITTKAKNPEQIVKWFDFAYGEKGHMLFNFGVEGESYVMKDGYPTYTEKMTNNPDGLPMSSALGQNIRAMAGGPFVQDKRYYEQYASYPQQKESIANWMKADHSKLMPPVTLTGDESREFAGVMNDVRTYTQEMTVKFIMGVEPLENFDKFVKTLEGFGIKKALEHQQSALERYNKR
jgi:putative aldouronate transport system substrate-binding protein